MPQQTLPSTLEQNLSAVRRRIAEAALRAGRSPFEVTLVGVTKTVTAERAMELFQLGLPDLGENRADELAAKAAWFRARGVQPRWHFLGHVQRNKARTIVEHASVIHSVDSARLLDTIERIAGELGRLPQVYIQVMIEREETKTGLEPAEVRAALTHARSFQHLRVIGLMAMAPHLPTLVARRAAARGVFTRLARLASEHRDLFETPPRLSMGMSDDFEVAVEAGSHVVRVGSALFATQSSADSNSEGACA